MLGGKCPSTFMLCVRHTCDLTIGRRRHDIYNVTEAAESHSQFALYARAVSVVRRPREA